MRCVSSRRHCARPDPDRSRWSQSSKPVSVRHRHRPQCAGQEPVQHPCQHAFIDEVLTAKRSGFIWTGEPQEVGIAAARSGDRGLGAGLPAGDVYHALARMCGLTTLDAKKLEGH